MDGAATLHQARGRWSDGCSDREGEPAIFDRNSNGWGRIPKNLELPVDQQDRGLTARELLVKFQMSPNHPMLQLNKA